MKVSEMNKKELLDHMNASGEIHRMSSESKAWQRAFALARVGGLENVELGCAKCYAKVKEWLTRD
jgi:hypothetical protein